MLRMALHTKALEFCWYAVIYYHNGNTVKCDLLFSFCSHYQIAYLKENLSMADNLSRADFLSRASGEKLSNWIISFFWQNLCIVCIMKKKIGVNVSNTYNNSFNNKSFIACK